MRDFFAVDDLELKELSTVPLEEYVLRGDFRRSLLRSRYFYRDDLPLEALLRARQQEDQRWADANGIAFD